MRNKRRMVSYFKGYNPPLKEMFIEEVFELVKGGKVKDTIEQLRLAKQKGRNNQYEKLKESLPSFTPSATYNKVRNKDSVKCYSSILSLDYDDIPLEDVNEIKKIICNQNEAYACFVSPSGDGLKVFVKTDNGEESHEFAFKQVKEHFDKIIGYEADKGCKDITRLCYLSFDKELYLNKESTEYAIDISKKPIEIKTAKISTGQVGEGNRNQLLTSVGGAMIRKGISQTAIFSALLEENKVKCVPPLNDDEVNTICNSICRYEPTDPIMIEKQKKKPEIDSHLDDICIGILGDFIKLIMPHTEAHLMSISFSFLASFGNMVGRKVYFTVEGGKHFPNLFVCIVGRTAKARKGTSWCRIESIFSKIDFSWLTYNVKSGLTTGEGLIHAVRDPKEEYNKKKKQNEIVDEGVTDKRFLAIEPEFSSVLNQNKGRISILSNVLRDAWDSKTLTTIIKNNREIATDPHISIVAHITIEDLKLSMSDVDLSNGFANRFLWVFVERSKKLPFGGDIPENKLKPIIEEIKSVMFWVKGMRSDLVMTFDKDAKNLWGLAYDDLSEGVEGVLGKVTSRSEPQVLRLSMIYALLEKSEVIKVQHLKAALSLWSYCMKSADYIFGDSKSDIINEKIINKLIEFNDGLTKTEIHKVFNNHHSKDKIEMSLSYLKQVEIIDSKEIATNGRPKTVYFLVTNDEKKEN